MSDPVIVLDIRDQGVMKSQKGLPHDCKKSINEFLYIEDDESMLGQGTFGKVRRVRVGGSSGSSSTNVPLDANGSCELALKIFRKRKLLAKKEGGFGGFGGKGKGKGDTTRVKTAFDSVEAEISVLKRLAKYDVERNSRESQQDSNVQDTGNDNNINPQVVDNTKGIKSVQTKTTIIQNQENHTLNSNFLRLFQVLECPDKEKVYLVLELSRFGAIMESTDSEEKNYLSIPYLKRGGMCVSGIPQGSATDRLPKAPKIRKSVGTFNSIAAKGQEEKEDNGSGKDNGSGDFGGGCVDYLDTPDSIVHHWYPERFSKLMTYDVLNGLKYLHWGLNIAHRDLKPMNILLCVNDGISGSTAWKDKVIEGGGVSSSQGGSSRNGSGFTISETRSPRIPVIAKIADFGRAIDFDIAYAPQKESFMDKIYDKDVVLDEENTQKYRKLGVTNLGVIKGTEGTYSFFPPEFCDVKGKMEAIERMEREENGNALPSPPPPLLAKPQDIWSLGVCTYTFMYGMCPFWADCINDLFETIARVDYKPVPDSWEEILRTSSGIPEGWVQEFPHLHAALADPKVAMPSSNCKNFMSIILSKEASHYREGLLYDATNADISGLDAGIAKEISCMKGSKPLQLMKVRPTAPELLLHPWFEELRENKEELQRSREDLWDFLHMGCWSS